MFEIIGVYRVSRPNKGTIGKAARYYGYDWLLNDKGRFIEAVNTKGLDSMGIVEAKVDKDFSAKSIVDAMSQPGCLEFYLDEDNTIIHCPAKNVGTREDLPEVTRVCFFLHFIQPHHTIAYDGGIYHIPEIGSLPTYLDGFVHFIPPSYVPAHLDSAPITASEEPGDSAHEFAEHLGFTIPESPVTVLGVYRVEFTDELLKKALKLKYPGRPPAGAKAAVREELLSVVLIEAIVKPEGRAFWMGDFGQEYHDQVAYDNQFLSEDGTQALGFDQPNEGNEFRVAFFLHYYNANRPLDTPFGRVVCPGITEMPERFSKLMPYLPVD